VVLASHKKEEAVKPRTSLIPTGSALMGGALIALYAWKVRPWMATWGTESEEANRTFPGDELIAAAMVQATRAVTIEAPPEVVWPWLVQMGLDRGGFYSIDRLDNEGRPSATTILPELQDLQEGDKIQLDRKVAARVVSLEPPRSMVWALLEAEVELGLTASLTMSYVLMPVDVGRTRLLSRVRGRVEGVLALAYVYLFDEWVNFMMQRKQLLGIKTRAEG
jgi:hypothetical protein